MSKAASPMAIVEPGWTLPLHTPHSKTVGKCRQHYERVFVGACGNVIKTGIGEGNTDIFGLGAVDLVPRIQPPLTQCEYMPLRQ